ncbi:CPBP family intramembrane glutamic endopeptidase [Metallosphaera javensis (ex Sakai et al. 2022)]|uniref:CPBP family intramembrane glutamic endopeptidase n=1 Tax=Metallosphaera javensis (ex Sakai et al. 2022) TaxID=2775498 RepID=UPI002586FE59
MVTIGEIVALILVKLITRRKTSLYINSGVMLSIPLILIMTLFPPPSPIGFRYPFLMFPAITGGICEELIYRDCILEKGRYDNYIQAILWSFNHVLDGPTFVFYTFIIGIILGLIARRFGVLPCVIAHVTANTLRIFL